MNLCDLFLFVVIRKTAIPILDQLENRFSNIS